LDLNLSPQQFEEIIRCRKSPIYFIETFGWLEEKGTRRILQFNPFEYQYKMLRWLKDGENILVLKDRRVGASWTTAAYAAWLINFFRGVNLLFLSKREEDSKKLLKKVKFVLKNLAYHDHPEHAGATKVPWLCNEIVTDNQQLFTTGFRNDQGQLVAESEASSLTTTSESGRSEGATLIFLDEFAFVAPDDESTWAAIKPTVARGGQWVMVSTPEGATGVFHRMCMQAMRNENRSYKFLEVNWWEAGITEKQVEAAKEGLDADKADQEWSHKFIQSGNPVFDATDLAACYKPLDEYPDIARELQRYHQEVGFYYSGVDSAVGKAHRRESLKDFNAWTSLTKTGIQACAYYDKKPLSTWAGHDVTLGPDMRMSKPGKTSELHRTYPGLAKIEDNGPGQAVLSRHVIPEDGESNALPSHTDAPTKSRLVNRLKLSIEAHDIVITDLFTYQQLQSYQHGSSPGQYEAAPGSNDDLVMGLAMANDLRFEYGNLEFTWASGEPAKRYPTPEEMETANIETAPLGPDFVPIDNLRASELMPGPGQLPYPDIPMALPDLSLVEDYNPDGEPGENGKNERKDLPP
jgi:hypothetical protein